MRFTSGRRKKPLLGRRRVGAGLGSGESLTGNKKQGGFWLRVLERLGQMSSIYIGDKVKPKMAFPVWLESLGHHNRTKIATANSDIDNALDWFAGVALPCTGADLFRERFHVIEDSFDFRPDVFAVDFHRIPANVSQGGMKYCSK